MSNKIITLSGAANEVLYALFFRGALLSGDLPSKSGTAELRELGFAETRHTATEYQKENHFTFLTSEGQKFAVEHLVNTRFGKQQYCTSMTPGVEIDTSAAQKAIDELDQCIRDTVSFELIRNGVPFINDATIANGAIHAAAIDTPQPVTNIYNISLGIQRDEPAQNKVTISTNEISIHANIEEVLRNALAANEEVERLRDAMKNAANEGVQQALVAVERDFKSNGKLRRLLGI
ncbi:Fur-regulated protein [Citrobacter braakii]|uniref:Fur-regulated protein n=1 Tax=Citrobacter braakii TaxID=57706 RepID=UPI00244BD9F4|nr:Fur-regulated protein [Citrobacter braakii]MDH1756146.1 Fur-regulated protein [Citrobacter braakii]MDH1854439.1 Fur-regulated protein [Citrobacter braakii]